MNIPIKSQRNQSWSRRMSEKSGIPETTFRRIVLFLNFALYRQGGTQLTKFAKTFGITSYEDLYEHLKKIKKNLKTDNEVHAINALFTPMFKSVVGRAKNWILTTFFNDSTKPEDIETAGFYASVFTINSFGIVIDNLKKLQKVISDIEKGKEEIQRIVERERFNRRLQEEST